TPGAVYSHDENMDATLEIDALAFSQSEGHLAYPRFSNRNAASEPLGTPRRVPRLNSAIDTVDPHNETQSNCRLPSNRTKKLRQAFPDGSLGGTLLHRARTTRKPAKPIQNRAHVAVTTLMRSP